MAHIEEFNRIVKKAEFWVKDVAEEMNTDNMSAALQASRAALQALRDRLPANEAAHLGAQLPLLIAGYFYEGWKPVNTPTKERSVQDFLDKVQTNIDNLGHSLKADEVVKPVFSVLARKISEGEARDVRNALPEELREIWVESAES
ncbi:MAG: DUF2267 domain-containing protein [Bacteroidota bacterium]